MTSSGFDLQDRQHSVSMLRDGHFMAAHLQGMRKLTSKVLLMRKQHDHVKRPPEQATARSLQLTSMGRLLTIFTMTRRLRIMPGGSPL